MSDTSNIVHDDPADVAATIAALDTPTLLVFDCDGVLAPLVDHADDSVLFPGVRDLLSALSAPNESDTTPSPIVAVLSGRSLAGLHQFDFPDDIIVVGSYGGERRGHESNGLSDTEKIRFDEIAEATEHAAATAGEGAWVEYKPGSVVLHVRLADPDAGTQALDQLAVAANAIDGTEAHAGSNVLELMARPSNKGSALRSLRDDVGPASVVYIGDDIPDEDAFAVLGEGDLSIKVGEGTTRAMRRLASPTAVQTMLRALVAEHKG